MSAEYSHREEREEGFEKKHVSFQKKTLAEEIEEQSKLGLQKLFSQLRNHLLYKAYKYGNLRTSVPIHIIGNNRDRIKALKALLEKENVSMKLNENVWIFEVIKVNDDS
jgi:hypothetical protein